MFYSSYTLNWAFIFWAANQDLIWYDEYFLVFLSAGDFLNDHPWLILYFRPLFHRVKSPSMKQRRGWEVKTVPENKYSLTHANACIYLIIYSLYQLLI